MSFTRYYWKTLASTLRAIADDEGATLRNRDRDNLREIADALVMLSENKQAMAVLDAPPAADPTPLDTPPG